MLTLLIYLHLQVQSNEYVLCRFIKNGPERKKNFQRYADEIVDDANAIVDNADEIVDDANAIVDNAVEIVDDADAIVDNTDEIVDDTDIVKH